MREREEEEEEKESVQILNIGVHFFLIHFQSESKRFFSSNKFFSFSFSHSLWLPFSLIESTESFRINTVFLSPFGTKI